MKLLFDQNLSRHLKQHLQDLYPDSLHVQDIGLESTQDNLVWEYAKSHGLTIVSKDSDFARLSATLGHPPKVVWLQLGNVTTAEVASILHNRYEDVRAFYLDEQSAFLVLP